MVRPMKTSQSPSPFDLDNKALDTHIDVEGKDATDAEATPDVPADVPAEADLTPESDETAVSDEDADTLDVVMIHHESYNGTDVVPGEPVTLPRMLALSWIASSRAKRAEG